MNLSNIDWDIENAGAWPVPVKAAIIVLLCLILGGLWYYLDTQDQIAQLETEEGREQELKNKFEQRQKKAANLEEYKEQMAEMEKSFGDLLRQLPDKTQVPELLVDVSQTGLAAGLEFELFKPGAEITKEFYAELPIEIRVIGDYMEFGAFISGLASLPRIVTIHNVKIAAYNKNAGSRKTAKEPLVMSALVRTYRYLEDGTVPANQVKKPQQKK
ncbi:type 4a pilus biogenesis protein PilO [Methylocaldum sp. MU1018]|jgi:type IV pilus assembly protein PilO